jgi:signal transduction histidine kinase
LTGLINGLLAVLCGAVIYSQNTKGPKNRIYALFCLSIAALSFFYFLWQTAKDGTWALFTARATMMGVIFVPVLQYHHTLLMFNLDTLRRRQFLHAAYALTFVFCLSDFTPWFFSGVVPRLMFPFWPVGQPAFFVFLVFYAVMSMLSLFLILEFRSNTTSAVLKNEMTWIAVPVALGYLGGATNFMLFVGIPYPPYLNPAISIFTLVGALLFFRLGLLDFKLFCRNATAAVLSAVILGGAFSVLAYALEKKVTTVLFIMSSSVLFALLYKRMEEWARKKVNLTRLGRIDRYLINTQNRLGAVRESTYTYERLAANMVEALLGTFPSSMAAMYMSDLQESPYHLKSQTGMANTLAQDLLFNRSSLAIERNDPLIDYLNGKKTIVVREEVEHEIRQGKNAGKALLDSMMRIEAQVCSPMFVMGQLKGVLVLGEKKENELFHEGDLNHLLSFSRMGEEVMRYIMGMELEINHTALYSHDMNNDTKSLVQTLQFIQSPLAAEVERDRMQELLKMAEDVAVRLNQTFQMNRDRSNLILMALKGEYKKGPVDMTKLMRESAYKLSFSVATKKIHFAQKFPAGPVFVLGNGDDLIRIFDNLLSNAVRYVELGGTIEMAGEVVDHQLRIRISDNGIGIKKEELDRIWQRGWQADDARKGASGMGLAIAKQIVVMHEGQIRVETNNPQGTVFFISFPLLETKETFHETARAGR